MKEEKRPILTTIEDVRVAANAVAEELRTASGKPPADLRRRFIDVRTALFQRGIFNPVLVRFDTASAPQAANAEVADELKKVAASLQP